MTGQRLRVAGAGFSGGGGYRLDEDESSGLMMRASGFRGWGFDLMRKRALGGWCEPQGFGVRDLICRGSELWSDGARAEHGSTRE